MRRALSLRSCSEPEKERSSCGNVARLRADAKTSKDSAATERSCKPPLGMADKHLGGAVDAYRTANLAIVSTGPA